MSGPAGWNEIGHHVLGELTGEAYLPVPGQRSTMPRVAKPTADARRVTPFSAIDLPPVLEIEINGVHYRGAPWRVAGGLLVSAANSQGDADGKSWSTAEGWPFTAQSDGVGGIPKELDVVTFPAPADALCVVREVQLLVDSEIAWQMLRFALLFGGTSQTQASGQVGRVLNAETTTGARPVDRNGIFDVSMRAPTGALVRLAVTNTSLESPHLVEAEIRGVLFPRALLEGRENWPGRSA